MARERQADGRQFRHPWLHRESRRPRARLGRAGLPRARAWRRRRRARGGVRAEAARRRGACGQSNGVARGGPCSTLWGQGARLRRRAAAAARHGSPGELHLARPGGKAAARDRSRPAQAERSRLRRGVCTAGDRIAGRRAQARSPDRRRPGHAAAAGGIRLSQVVRRQPERDPGAARDGRSRHRRQDAKMTGERQMMKSFIAISLALGAAGASAQQTVNMPIAIEEINAKGGILQRKINAPQADTQSNAGISRAQVQKAIDGDPYVILGPVFSGSVKVNMVLAQQAEVPQIVGAEAADITQAGNPYIFRTSFGQQMSMPKIANYLRDGLKARTVAVLWVNNDFGKGGRDTFVKEMAARNIKVVSDVSTESGQMDFAADVVKLKGANADAIFVYTNEEESARFLREARKQGIDKPLIGETTLLGQKVIDMAGPAANGARGHVGLSADAPVPAVLAFKEKFNKRFSYVPDHNGIKGYTGVYAVKYATEQIGKFDRKLLARTMHGLTIKPEQEPGILMETTWDNNGDIDRISFLAEVVDGKQKIVQTLPKLGK